MKSSFALIGLFLLCITGLSAQSNNAILFTENGEPFQVILNGILQNPTAQTNVKMTSLTADAYKCRILFQDTRLGYLDFNMVFPDMNEEITWNIKRNSKGEFVTRYISAVPLAEAPPTPPTQTVVVYTATPVVSGTTTTVQQTQTTTTTTGGGMQGDNVNFNMGFNVDGESGSININASGLDVGMNINDGYSSNSSTTTTTTHTVTTTTSGNGGAVISNPPPRPQQIVYVSGYNGAIGCPVPMSPGDFSNFKQSVSSKDFENTKLTIAKQVIQNNCLTAQQVKETMGLFDFEATKLDFAKFAYGHTYDTGNYFVVNDAFEFESSVDELNKYISR
ncbi:MAG: hypothetical protein RIQ47_1262 [Bacteroidota bacterium]